VSSTERVDVVIPTCNTRDITLRAVAAVVAEKHRGLTLRCIVVDNASKDRTSEAIRARWSDVVVIRNATDHGYGRACNQGADAGGAGHLLILNSDVFAGPGAIQRLLAFLDENPDCVAVSGRLVEVGTDRPQVGFAVRAFPSLGGQLALLLGLERFWPSNPISRRQVMSDFAYDRTQDLDAQPAGACILVRRSDYEALGGFDEWFNYWFEDVDLLRRLRARGRIAYCHDASFEHVGGASFAHWARPRMIGARYHGLLRYFNKHHSRREVIALRAVVALLSVLRALVLWPLARERARAYRGVARLAVRMDALPALAPRARDGGAEG
jgi:GT2 family glycosyltransferase